MTIDIFPSFQRLAKPRLTPAAPFTFSRASSASRINELGFVETVSSNLIRHDFDSLSGVYRGWLLEEARTNLLLRSAEFDNASWSNAGAQRTANATLSPENLVNADKLAADGSAGEHGVRQEGIVGTPTLAHAFSVFAKAGEFSRVMLRISSSSGSNECFFNLNGAGSIISTNNNGGASGTVGRIEAFSNGWFRLFITGIPGNAAGTVGVHIHVVNDSGAANFTGSTGSGLHFWGAQLEVGANSTSYIGTTSAQVTRAADVASIALNSFPFHPTEGTLLIDASVPGNAAGSEFFAIIDDGGLSNFIGISNPNTPAALVTVGGVTQASITLAGAATNNVGRRLAVAWKQNDVRAATNGTLGSADTSANIPTGLTTLRLAQHVSGANLNGHIRHIAYFPRALVNADLQEITQ